MQPSHVSPCLERHSRQICHAGVFSLLFAFSLALPAIVLFSVALSRVSMFYAFFSASSASTRRSEETERYFLCSGTSSLESESKVRPRVRILRRIP